MKFFFLTLLLLLPIIHGEMLCGDSSSIVVPQYNTCGGSNETTTVSWERCCDFNRHTSPMDVCREATHDRPYCTGVDCDGTNLKLSVRFMGNDSPCCMECSAYGDPEARAFNGMEDVWIVCDARLNRNSCRMYKDTCLNLTDPNNNKCKWIAGNAKNSNRWDVGTNGSPCIPDLTEETRMNLIRTGEFGIDLVLGERGVIDMVHISVHGGETYSMSGFGCFDMGMTPWSSEMGSPIPSTWRRVANMNGISTTWFVFDEMSGTTVKILCTRRKKNDERARLNLQHITAPIDSDGEGFCYTGYINDKTGDTDGSVKKHADCIQSNVDSLQACKYLVNLGYTPNELKTCAEEYCSAAYMDNTQCISRLVRRSNEPSRWIEVYCKSLRIQGIENNIRECEKMIRKRGWSVVTRKWGTGVRRLSDMVTSCGSNIEDYAIHKKKPCSNGLYIDVKDMNGEWVPKYFIGSDMPPCNGHVLLNDYLATNIIRVRQCESINDEMCIPLGQCEETPGVEFSLTWDNIGQVDMSSTLCELYNTGVLQCTPDQNGNTEWCFPNNL